MSFKYFKSLLFKSAQIQHEIDKEQGRRWPDSLRLIKLKKIRLAIKDRMERIIQQGIAKKIPGGFRQVKITMPKSRKKEKSHAFAHIAH